MKSVKGTRNRVTNAQNKVTFGWKFSSTFGGSPHWYHTWTKPGSGAFAAREPVGHEWLVGVFYLQGEENVLIHSWISNQCTGASVWLNWGETLRSSGDEKSEFIHSFNFMLDSLTRQVLAAHLKGRRKLIRKQNTNSHRKSLLVLPWHQGCRRL